MSVARFLLAVGLATVAGAAAAHPPSTPGGWLPPEFRSEPQPPWLRALRETPADQPTLARLRNALPGAARVVIARGTQQRSLDDGRLVVTQIEVLHDLDTPDAVPVLHVVDARGALRRRALTLRQPLLLVLDTAPAHSYLHQHLGDDVHHQLAVPALPLDEVDAKRAQRLADWLVHDSAASRAATLALLADGHHALAPLLAADLDRHDPQRPLTTRERSAVEAVLQHARPGAVALTAWLATAKDEPLPADATDPVLRAWLWRTRAARGDTVPAAVALRDAKHLVPAARAASAVLLVLADGDDVIAGYRHLLLDDEDRHVRLAALDALPSHRNRERALDWLAEAFDDGELRLAAGRVLLTHYAELAPDWLGRRVLRAASPAAREHAAKLLVSRIGTDDPRAQSLAYVADNGEVRRILSAGIVRNDLLHTHGESHSHPLPPIAEPP